MSEIEFEKPETEIVTDVRDTEQYNLIPLPEESENDPSQEEPSYYDVDWP